MNKDKIVEAVKEKLTKRSTVGLKKYGTTIWGNTDENYIKHLQDELLDGANYCEQLMRLGHFQAYVAASVENEPNDMELGKRVRAAYNKMMEECV